MPKVSVIVPVYNVEGYLCTCMNSLVRQTLHDIEIICVNDGSTDHSLDILRKYAAEDGRVILVNKENGGYGKAMNDGLDRATGEYIGIVEPDDFVSLTMFEDLYQIANEKQLDFVKADFYRFYTNDETETQTSVYTHLSPNSGDYGLVFRPMDKTASFFFVMNTWAGIYRHSFLKEYKIRHHETPGAAFQDNGFWFQTFIYAERAMILDKAYYFVRRDNPNSSIRNPSKIYAMNIEYDYIRGILMRDPAVWEKLKAVYWRKRYHNYHSTMKRIEPSDVGEYLRRISKEVKHGFDRGEFSAEDFPEGEWRNMKAIMENKPIIFPEDTQAGQLELILNSRSYKLGRMITYLPRKVKAFMRGERVK